MKKLALLILLISCTLLSFGQEETKEKKLATIPSVDIKALDGQTFNTINIDNDGKPIIISLWATWCKPCIAELLAIADVYDEWVEETGVKLVAISIDDARSAARVKPWVDGKDWPYEVYLDQNKDFARAMNVVNVPHTFIINGEGEIVWQHTSYQDGGEEELIEKVRELLK